MEVRSRIVSVLSRSVLVGAAYYAAARAGLLIASAVGGYAAPVWPATGIAAAALLVWGFEMVPAVWLAGLAARGLLSADLDLSQIAIGGLMAAGSVFEATVMTYLLKRVLEFSPTFQRVTDVTNFILASIIAPAASATFGVATLYAFSVVQSPTQLPQTWATWWIGDVLGALIVAPVLLSWAVRKTTPPRKISVSGTGVYPLALGFMCVCAFFGFVPPEMRALFAGFVVYSALVWCALSLPVCLYFNVMALVAAVEIFAALRGDGLLGNNANLLHRLSLLQFVLGCTTISLMMLSAAVRERLAALKTAHERELSLLESDKLANLGRMVGAIAHEINGPLFIIAGKADLLKARAQSGALSNANVVKDASSIHAMAGRIEKIVKSVRFFSRFSAADPFEFCGLKEIIAETIEICGEQFRQKGIQLMVDEVPESLSLECRPVEIGQVLLNLLNNACCAAAERPEKWVRLSAAAEGDRLQIAVIDSGTGIDPSVKERLFQPFFTTKKPTEGTGIGLSVSKAIIENHGGTVSIDPESPYTRFVVSLPRRHVG